MEAGKRSMNAVLVAAVRAYHSSETEPRIFDDPIACLLLSSTDLEVFEKTCFERLRELNPTLAASCPDGAAFVHPPSDGHVM